VPLTELFLTALAAFAVSAALCVVAIRAGIGLRIADVPGGRRKHARVTSRLGALPLFGGFVAAALLTRQFDIPTTDARNESIRFAGLLIGGLIVFVLGVADDKFELSARAQLPFQVLAGGVAIASLIFIERFRSPLSGAEIVLSDWPVIGFAVVAALTLFWFLGMMNTVNLLDGVDGLSGSVALIAALVTLIHMLRAGQYSTAVLPAALCGALLGFLLFNMQPARLFLGGGALFLGFALAALGIIAGAKIALLLLVMGLPIADVLWQMFDRARHGRHPMSGDRGHLHFRLADRGWSPRGIVALYALVCGAFGGVALAPLSPGAKLVALALITMIVIVALARLTRATRGN
jgi:UDP-GlcNAc:undecaprenyl-phosphate/decaprenyl-phosphate GlcNAc-1-phosphate transferase